MILFILNNIFYFRGFNVTMSEVCVSVPRLKNVSRLYPSYVRPNPTYTLEKTLLNISPPKSPFPTYAQLLKEKISRVEARTETQNCRRNTYCNLCNLMFQTDSEIISHVETHHAPTRESTVIPPVFRCKQCNKAFSSQHRVNLHYLRRHFK